MYGKDMIIHAIFKYSAARREDYQQLQANLGADIETFQQHTCKNSLAKYWPCHSPCAWTVGHDLLVYQGSWER